MRGQDFSTSQVRVGQRWRYTDESWNVVLEVLKVVYEDTFNCRIVDYQRGPHTLGYQSDWTFAYRYGDYEYMEGQDRPQ